MKLIYVVPALVLILHVFFAVNSSEASQRDAQTPEGFEEFLSPTKYCDSNNPDIKNAAANITKGARTQADKAIKIFNFVRDEILFALCGIKTASETLQAGMGQCVTKASLQISLLRAENIPARYHIADVHKNCLKGIVSPKLFNNMKETITDHCWCECYLSGKWISCETFFDTTLYVAALKKGVFTRQEVPSIEWDGANDLIVLSSWILKDKGTVTNSDKSLDSSKLWMDKIWPIQQESNLFTMQLRACGMK